MIGPSSTSGPASVVFLSLYATIIMAFFEDPRLRQRWNQIAQDAEAATENAAATIWSFQHDYINPCFGWLSGATEHCTSLCFGDAEERRRRRRERERARHHADFGFDFYDDWYEEEQRSRSLLSTWGGDDWDRLLAGSGSQRKQAGDDMATEQPRRKRGMSYGTRGHRRKTGEADPTIIPSTQPIGFLSRLPWRVGGTLRYKPSAADLQDRGGKHDEAEAEAEPLLPSSGSPDHSQRRLGRQRSGTTGSGDTSDSYRSRGDLFPSDGEGDEDAVPLDDEITYAMMPKDDRSSGKSDGSGRRGQRKGKRPVHGRLSSSQTLSRATLASSASTESLSCPPELEGRPSNHPPPAAGGEEERVFGATEAKRSEHRQTVRGSGPAQQLTTGDRGTASRAGDDTSQPAEHGPIAR